MKKDPEIFLKHIIECIGVIKEYTKKVSRDDFFNDQRLQDAVIRKYSVAANRRRPQYLNP